MLPLLTTFGELGRHVGRLAKPVLSFEGAGCSGEQVCEQARAIARGLMALGVGPGDRVCAWLPNSPEFVFIELAVAMIGGIFVPIQPRYGTREVRNILTASDPVALMFARRSRQLDLEATLHEICGPASRSLVETGIPGISPSLRHVIATGDREEGPWQVWQDVLDGGRRIPESNLDAAIGAVQAGDPAVCIFTSGTTGMPKGALLAHAAILSTERSVAEILRLTDADNVLYGAPLASVFGCCNALVASWTASACLVIQSVFDAAEALATIESRRCSVIYGVPTMFHMLLEHPSFAPARTASLRTGIVGGAPCPPVLAAAIRDRLGVRELTSGYGMSETCAIATMTSLGESIELVTGSVGRPLPGVNVKVVESSGLPAPAATEGEICMRGSNLMLGYFDAAKGLTRPFDAEGWFRSGDAGALGPDGNLRITGRISDMILVGGFNVYPAELENLLAENPAIAQAYVVGVPDHRLGERPVAFVQNKPGESLTEDAVMAFCARQLARYKMPGSVFFVSEFPTTPLALQLLIWTMSESMCSHDSKIVGADGVDRRDACAVGEFSWRGQEADTPVVQARACCDERRPVPGRSARR